MFSRLVRVFFRDYSDASVPVDDPAIPVGHRGNVPVYIGGVKEGIERLKLRPIVIRSTRHRRPCPVEQGPIGLAADQDFQPPPAPLVAPKGTQDAGQSRQPYAVDPETFGLSPTDLAQIERASSTMWAPPYQITPRQLSQ
jgi:hypothetical protein